MFNKVFHLQVRSHPFYQLFSRISEHILSFLTEFLIWSPGLTHEELTHALAK